MSVAQASLFVDTSVWSLALRRDRQPAHAAVAILERALLNADSIIIAGIVLQELLQGFRGPKDQARLLRYLQALPLIEPTRETHVRAA
ncbi:MAG: PIN domain-containing protein [Elusimicrobia bacterium]|nr:MAG: PIN domain-containing protein [Gammaproteobacteria bacterium]TXH27454.1 MAG: PIN domain-containing protein [Elusimicrobiota bacterium]